MESFHCHQCWLNAEEINYEELNQFGQYGDNARKIKDKHWYCDKHFKEKEEKYDKKHIGNKNE